MQPFILFNAQLSFSLSPTVNLYSLFHSTNRMGGYDQVTVNRKWSSVFDSMGYSTSMTCASTVTRKHYEK